VRSSRSIVLPRAGSRQAARRNEPRRLGLPILSSSRSGETDSRRRLCRLPPQPVAAVGALL